jgi:serine phosphatase RsbU (regulator of sigma subunit)
LSADAQSLEVFASSGADPDHPSIILDTSGGLPQEPEAQAASSRRPVWFNDAASSGLVHPIFGSEQLVGTLTLGRNTKGQGTLGSTIFNASQTNVISTLADFLMIQVERARAAEAQLTARATERELEIARNIQLSLLPQQLPALPGVRMAAHCESARQVGGDFYDALPVSHEATLLVIADVMGKGMPAALFAATLRTALRSAPELFRKPGQLLARANQLLHDELSAVDMFITAQLALVDVKANRVIIASAGHGPLLLWHGGTTTCQALSPEGLPLGVRPDTTFEETRLVLAPQFSLMMSTDGLSEAKNIAGQHLGQPALQQWFATSARNSDTAIAMRESLLTELGNFRGEAPLADDQTFLIAARTPE